MSTIFLSEVGGGSTRVAYAISRELARRGHDVSVFSSDARDAYSRTKSGFQKLDGMKIYRFKNVAFRIFGRSKFFLTPEMVNALRREIAQFDVIHLHDYRTFQNIIVHHYAEKHRIPYILQAHGSLPRAAPMRYGKWTYDVFFGQSLLQNASKLVSLNSAEAKQYESRGVPKDKIKIIPNGIDLTEYRCLPAKGLFRRKFGIKGQQRIVLYLGRIHRTKGLDFLVEAFARIADKLGDVRLVFAGPDDGYLEKLRALIRVLKIENQVQFAGPLYGRSKLEAFVDADVYVLPSRYETFPLTILEAYACCTPVVASRVDGLKDLVQEDVTGLLFDPGSVEQLAGCLFDLLSNNERACELGMEGRSFVEENFPLEKVVDRLEKVFAEASNN